MRRIFELGLTGQILLGLGLGVLCGVIFGSSIAPIGIIGKVVIQLIKAFAVPLIFFAIVEALLSTNISLGSAGRLLMIVSINAVIAAAIGLSLSNLIKPGEYLNLQQLGAEITTKPLATPGAGALSLENILSGYLPESVIAPFVENNVIAVVLVALLLGLLGRQLGEQEESDLFQRIMRMGLRLFELVLRFLVRLVPLAVFAVSAKTVGEYGFAPLRGLAVYVGVGLTGLFLQGFVVYPIWIRVMGAVSVRQFFSAAKPTLVYAFGTNSSLATLPLTLKSLDGLGVSKTASRLGACVGTNLNNDGIVLYEAMAVLLVAQAHGMSLSWAQQVSVVLLAIVSAIGVSGVPEAGVIALSLVLTAVGLPLEILPLLLTVDWLIARARSVVNVLSDMTVSIVLDGFEKRQV